MEHLVQPVWEKKVRESPQSYACFVLYMEMGSTRSFRNVWEEAGLSKTLVERWAKRWSWTTRAREYDAYEAKVRVDAFYNRRLRAIERQADLGEKLREKAHMAVDLLPVDGLVASDICRLAETGVKIERLAYGDSTSNVRESNTVQFVLGELPQWAKGQVADIAQKSDSASVPANPHARSFSAKELAAPVIEAD